jgi:hypothetical protein
VGGPLLAHRGGGGSSPGGETIARWISRALVCATRALQIGSPFRPCAVPQDSFARDRGISLEGGEARVAQGTHRIRLSASVPRALAPSGACLARRTGGLNGQSTARVMPRRSGLAGETNARSRWPFAAVRYGAAEAERRMKAQQAVDRWQGGRGGFPPVRGPRVGRIPQIGAGALVQAPAHMPCWDVRSVTLPRAGRPARS